MNGKGDNTRITTSISISNVGDIGGAEIPQAYLSFPQYTNEPPKLLRGFEKVYLQAGEKKIVDFVFTKNDLSFWDEESEEWKLGQGEFMVYVGASSRDIRGSGSFTI